MNRPARFFFTVFVLALALAGAARAQDRWLLVFENSAAMKKRMPAANIELQKLLFTSMAGKMHAGDHLGVWSFDQKLHVGEFPLRSWEPENAVGTFTNLKAYLDQRSYKGEVNFNVLEPVLTEVVAGSRRLTVLIFCEGHGEIIWTPYNAGINHALQTGYDERKKSGQPFVIVLRVQEGKYFSASVNFPPGDLNFPAFPEETVEAASAPAITNIVLEPEKKKPLLDDSPLFIVGTNVGTNLAQMPPPPPKVEITAPPVAVVAAVTNPPAATAGSTNQQASVTNSPAPAGAGVAPAAPAKPVPDNGYWLLVLTGACALVSAVALGIFLVARQRQSRGSLISDSLNSPRFPPSKK